MRFCASDDRGIEADAGERGVEGGAGNATSCGQRPKCFYKSAERSLLRPGDFVVGRGSGKRDARQAECDNAGPQHSETDVPKGECPALVVDFGHIFGRT